MAERKKKRAGTDCPAAIYQKIKSKYANLVAKNPGLLKTYRKTIENRSKNISDDEVLSVLALMYMVSQKPEFLTSCEERVAIEFLQVRDSEGNALAGVRTNMDQDSARKLMKLADSYDVDPGPEPLRIEGRRAEPPKRIEGRREGTDSFRALLEDIDRV